MPTERSYAAHYQREACVFAKRELAMVRAALDRCRAMGRGGYLVGVRLDVALSFYRRLTEFKEAEVGAACQEFPEEKRGEED